MTTHALALFAKQQSATLGGREAAAEAGQQGPAAAAELAGLREEADRQV